MKQFARAAKVLAAAGTVGPGEQVGVLQSAAISPRERAAPLKTPDTGTLKGDIEAIIAAIPDFDQAARQQMAVLVGLASAASRDPELRTAFAENLLERPRRLLRDVLDRAVLRPDVLAPDQRRALPHPHRPLLPPFRTAQHVAGKSSGRHR
jgi:hypothetical protein